MPNDKTTVKHSVISSFRPGGNTPQVSYSAVLGANAAALYQQAVAGG